MLILVTNNQYGISTPFAGQHGYDQIAELAGLNEAAVRKRYSRALAEMGKHLKKAGL